MPSTTEVGQPSSTAPAPAASLVVRLARGARLDLGAPVVMGVVNVTPDSFSDGGRTLAPDDAVAAAEAMLEAGAALVDIGGESTRPGAPPVSEAEELRRVLPVLGRLAARGFPLPLSIDTRKAAVAREALAAGAALVNDVSGLRGPGLLEAVAEAGAAVIIGHMQGTPETMQRDPTYGDVVAEVELALAAARDRARAAGVAADAVLVDPGIGFGKTLEHNLALLGATGRLARIAPLCVGVSRKSLLGRLVGSGGTPRPVGDRLAAGLGAAVAAVLGGARVVRAHDVQATADALRAAWAVRLAVREGGRDVA